MNEIEKLEKAGFKAATDKVKRLKEMKRKMAIAYEHFRYVRQEKIDAFNERLGKESMKDNPSSYTYKRLMFIPIDQYQEVPPSDVLDKVEVAQEIGCFDTFEVARIQDVVVQKDPIVFGRIEGCPDRFFVAQWDDDVTIEQILKENEG